MIGVLLGIFIVVSLINLFFNFILIMAMSKSINIPLIENDGEKISLLEYVKRYEI